MNRYIENSISIPIAFEIFFINTCMSHRHICQYYTSVKYLLLNQHSLEHNLDSCRSPAYYHGLSTLAKLEKAFTPKDARTSTNLCLHSKGCSRSYSLLVGWPTVSLQTAI